MPTSLQSEKEASKAIETKITPAYQKATMIMIKTPEDRVYAVDYGKSLRHLQVEIELRFHPTANREEAHELWTKLKSTENAFYKPILEAMDILRKKIGKYDTDVSIAAQKAADEAEAKRREAERKEEERLEKKAKTAEKNGKVEVAESLREQAQNVTVAPAFTPPAEAKKLIWKARVTNSFQACQSIGAGMIPFSVVEFKQAQLNAFAKGYNGRDQIPGIQFYQETVGRI